MVISMAGRAQQHIQNIIGPVFGKKNQSGLRGHLAKSTAGTFILKGTTILVGFLTTLLLARLLGATGYGVYTYVMSIIILSVIPATLGLPKLLIRNLASYRTRTEWGLMRGLLRWSNWVVLAASVVLVLIGALVIGLLSNRFQHETVTTFWISLIILPLMALSQIRQGALQGLNHIITGQLPETIVRPLLFIILVGGAYFLFGGKVSAAGAMGLQAIAACSAFLVGTILLQRALPPPVKDASPSYEIRAWLRSSLPLLLIGGIGIINRHTDILMLGALKGAREVGIYRVALRGAMLIQFMLGVVNIVIGPTISSLYAEGNMARLQRVVTKSARLAFLLSLPLGLGLIVFGKWFLLLFGHEFLQGTRTLAILSLGQLVNVGAGSVGLILVMTEHEDETFKGLVVAIIAKVALNALLIPLWDMEGAAVATTVSLITWNILLGIRVHRKLGISPSALGTVKQRRTKL